MDTKHETAAKIHETAVKILETIDTRRFADWYADGGDFDLYISGDTDAPTRKEILSDIKEVFRLNDK